MDVQKALEWRKNQKAKSIDQALQARRSYMQRTASSKATEISNRLNDLISQQNRYVSIYGSGGSGSFGEYAAKDAERMRTDTEALGQLKSEIDQYAAYLDKDAISDINTTLTQLSGSFRDMRSIARSASAFGSQKDFQEAVEVSGWYDGWDAKTTDQATEEWNNLQKNLTLAYGADSAEAIDATNKQIKAMANYVLGTERFANTDLSVMAADYLYNRNIEKRGELEGLLPEAIRKDTEQGAYKALGYGDQVVSEFQRYETSITRPNETALRNEIDVLQGEISAYERSPQYIEMSNINLRKQRDYAERSAVRSFINPTKEEMDAYDVADHTTQTAPIVNDPLRVYLDSSQKDKEDAVGIVANAHENGRTSTYYEYVAMGGDKRWDLLTEEEINDYYYHLSESPEAAMQYLDRMDTVLDARAMEEYNKEIAELPLAQRAVLSVMSSIYYAALSPIEGVRSFVLYGLSGATGKNLYDKNDNKLLSRTDAYRASVAQEMNADGKKFLGVPIGNLFSSVVSGADSLLTALYSFGMGKVFAGSGSFAKIAQELGGISMGVSAARSKMDQLYDEGASITQVINGGIGAYATEWLTERFSLGMLYDSLASSAGKTWWQAALNAGGQVFGNASEEAAAKILETAVDKVNLGSNSEQEKLIRQMMNAGLSREEAQKEVTRRFWSEVWSDAVGGAISGGMFSVATLSSSAAYSSMNKLYAQEIIENKQIDRVLASAKTTLAALKKDSGIYKRLDAAIEAVQRDASVKNVKNLLRQFDRAATTVTAKEISEWDLSVLEKRKLKAELKNSPENIALAQMDAEDALMKMLQSSKKYAVGGGTTNKDTGEEITITGIYRTRERGEPTLVFQLEDGSTIHTDDVSYANNNMAVMAETLARTGIRADYAMALFGSVREDADGEAIARGVTYAIRSGSIGENYEVARQFEEAAGLTDDQFKVAYAAGESLARDDLNRRKGRAAQKTASGIDLVQEGGKVVGSFYDGTRDAVFSSGEARGERTLTNTPVNGTVQTDGVKNMARNRKYMEYFPSSHKNGDTHFWCTMWAKSDMVQSGDYSVVEYNGKYYEIQKHDDTDFGYRIIRSLTASQVKRMGGLYSGNNAVSATNESRGSVYDSARSVKAGYETIQERRTDDYSPVRDRSADDSIHGLGDRTHSGDRKNSLRRDRSDVRGQRRTQGSANPNAVGGQTVKTTKSDLDDGEPSRLSVSVEDQTGTRATTRQQIRIMEAIAKIANVNIEIYESHIVGGVRQFTDRRGMVHKGNAAYIPSANTIVVDIHAGDYLDGLMLNAVSHEVVHFIAEMSPDKFRKLADFVVGKFGEKGRSVTELINAKQRKYGSQGQDLSFMDAFEEVVADSVESMLAQKADKIVSDIAEMRKVDADLAKTFVDKLKDLVGKMVSVFKKNNFSSDPETEEGRFFAKWTEVQDELAGIFAEGVADAADRAALAAYRSGRRAGQSNAAEKASSGKAVVADGSDVSRITSGSNAQKAAGEVVESRTSLDAAESKETEETQTDPDIVPGGEDAAESIERTSETDWFADPRKYADELWASVRGEDSPRKENTPANAEMKSMVRNVRELGIPWVDNFSDIKDQLKQYLDVVNQMKPVNTVSFSSKDRTRYAEKLLDILKTRFGYRVERQDIGTILFDEKAVANMRKYVGTDAEAAAFLSAPYVLKRGRIICGQQNHKNKGYPSVTIAAPVEINGMTGNVAVTVLFAGKRRAHALRILAPNGAVFELGYNKNGSAYNDGNIAQGDAEPSISTTNHSISNPSEKINPSGKKSSLRNLSNRQLIAAVIRSHAEVLDEKPVYRRFLNAMNELDDNMEKRDELRAEMKRQSDRGNKPRADMLRGRLRELSEEIADIEKQLAQLEQSSEIQNMKRTMTKENTSTFAEVKNNLTEAELKAGENFADFVEAVSHMIDRSKISKRKLKVGSVSAAHKQIVNGLMRTIHPEFSADGYELWIDGTGADHIERRHGKNGEADHSMQFREDKELIPWAVNTPDGGEFIRNKDGSIRTSDRFRNADDSRSPEIRLRKNTTDGIMYVSECVVDGANKRIYITSAYKTKDSTNRVLNMESSDSLQPTSKTPIGNHAINDSISNPAEKINPSGKKSSLRNLSNRQLIADMIRDHVENQQEKGIYNKFVSNIDKLDAMQERLEVVNSEHHLLKWRKQTQADKQRIVQLEQESALLTREINEVDRVLLRMEILTPFKNMVDNAKKQQKVLDEAKRKEDRERRTRRETRDKVKRAMMDLNRYLIHNSKEKHVPIDLQKPIAEALNALNLDYSAGNSRRAKDYLYDVKGIYEKILNDPDPLVSAGYSEVISDLLAETIELVGDTSIHDMSQEQLDAVYRLFRAMRKTITTANRSHNADIKESTGESAKRIEAEIRSVASSRKEGTDIGEWARKFSWESSKPIYAFRRIGSQTLMKLFQGLLDGQYQCAQDLLEADEFRRKLDSAYNVSSWKMDQTHTFKDRNGRTFELTLGQIFSVYATSRREHGLQHLFGYGVVSSRSVEVVKKNKLNLPIKYRVNDQAAHPLDEGTLADIVKTLSDDQKAYIERMQEYLSKEMADKGNEITLRLYEMKLFGEKNYYPIRTAAWYNAFNPEAGVDPKIKSPAWAKQINKYAKSPIVIENFADVWTRHVEEMSTYHSLALPVEDLTRVMNCRNIDESGSVGGVRQALADVFGEAPGQYISTLLRDLNGGIRMNPGADLISKGVKLAKMGSTMLKLSVAIQQPSSVIRAMAYIDAKYFGKSFAANLDLRTHNRQWEEVKKYCPVAIIKEMGGFDSGLGQSAREWLQEQEYKGFDNIKALFTDKIHREKVMGYLPAVMDELAWVQIWNAVKAEMSDKTDLTGKALYEAAGKRFCEVIELTQVYDSTLSRSGHMRAQDTGAKMATAFAAEPTAITNMLFDAALGVKRGRPGAGKFLARVGGVLFGAMALNAFLKSFATAMNDDDEDKTYLEKYLKAYAGNILDDVFLFNLIPYVRDVVSIIQGYDVERMDMAPVADLVNDVRKLFNDGVSADEIIDVFGDILVFFGLPLKNLKKDMASFVRTCMSAITSDRKTTGVGVGLAIREGVTGKDFSKADQLYEAYLAGDEVAIRQARSAYKTSAAADAALLGALRDNDKRIQQAGEYRYAGEMLRQGKIVNQIVAEGHFSNEQVIKAVVAQANAIAKELEPESESYDGSYEVSEDHSDPMSYTTSDLKFAMERGDDIEAIVDAIVQNKTANGRTRSQAQSDVRRTVMSAYREAYLAAYAKGDRVEMERIRQILIHTGLWDGSSAVKNVLSNWIKNKEE